MTHAEPSSANEAVLAEAWPNNRSIGFYVHVPFCEQRCHYCSFNTAPLGEASGMRRFLGALDADIRAVAALPWAGRVAIASIFFGGGTPSLLEPDALAAVLDAVRGGFVVADDAEITVECNPESVTRGKLAAYRRAGVNRVSLGIQSLENPLLTTLGRLHDARGARAAFDAAREAGHDNVSVDVMYGLPALDVPTWERTVTAVLDWNPDHLSAYGLTLDGGSAWGTSGVAGLPPEDVVVEQYWVLARHAAARGYEHYEISNYARPDFRSRHNLTYWRRGEYLAAGPGACGFVGDVRYANVKPVSRYRTLVERHRSPIDTFERLGPRQEAAERLLLGLRTSDGVDAAWVDARIAGDHTARAAVDAWQARGLLTRTADRVTLTEAGFLLSDALFIELL